MHKHKFLSRQISDVGEFIQQILHGANMTGKWRVGNIVVGGLANGHAICNDGCRAGAQYQHLKRRQ